MTIKQKKIALIILIPIWIWTISCAHAQWKPFPPSSGSGSGITLPQARAGTGWTNQNGTITRDTVANRIEWGGVHQSNIKVFDADNDTTVIGQLGNGIFVYKDGITALFTIDSSGTPFNSTASLGERFGVTSVASALGTVAFGPSATASQIQAIAIGGGTPTASGQSTIALGYGSNATNTGSIAIGASSSNTVSAGMTLKATQFYLGNAGTGQSSSAPTNATIQATEASGTNVAGATLSFIGGKATGNADGGDLDFYTTIIGGSGTTVQSITQQMSIESNNGGMFLGDASSNNGLLTIRASDADAYTVSINTTDQALFSGAGNGYSFDDDILTSGDIIFSAGTLNASSVMAALNIFAGNAEVDTVLVSGVTSADMYHVTFRTALDATVTSWYVEAKNDTFIVHLVGVSTGTPEYNWLRVKQ